MPAPIDIVARPQPRPIQKSALTSQLQAAGQNAFGSPRNESALARSINQSGGIPMPSRFRRESNIGNELARSIMGGGGMSWGGVSVGSWIRDDIMITSGSPMAMQSPSYHSSSYLPKLEAEFCRDFSCCGLPLPTLHDLLRHYEEHHAQQMPVDQPNNNGQSNHGDRSQARIPQSSNTGMPSTLGSGIQMEMMRYRQRQQQEDTQMQDDQREGVVTGDMDMDDDDMTPPPNTQQNMSSQLHANQQHMGHSQPTASMGHTSYNTTPNLPNSRLPNFPTAASHFSPESSAPSTPIANDQMDYTFQQQNIGAYHPQQTTGFALPYASMGMMTNDMGLEMCIDEPAKRLFSPGGQAMSGISSAQLQMLMNSGGNMNPRIGGDTMLQQAPTMQTHLMQQEEKPFKCPVIGCEKAYKNQNGLKYHKSHGHTNQTLHDNADGTFSIVNPETSAPYPGTLGMEKEKPYRCEFCGKRYKNLNGLKYHRSHSNHPNSIPRQTLGVGIPGSVVAVAGGLAGEA